jgi:hypothetical protein
MFYSQHGDSYVRVGELRHCRGEAVRLMAEYHADREAWLPVEEIDGMDAGLYGRDFVARLPQTGQGLRRLDGALPRHAFLGAEGCFRDHPVGWTAGEAGQIEPFNPCGIGCAEERPNVVEAAHVFEQYGNGQGADRLIRGCRGSGPKGYPEVCARSFRR